MSGDIFDILTNSNKDIDNQKLMDYVSNNSSADEQHALEKEMNDSKFINEAVEGLQQIKDKEQIHKLVTGINITLTKQLDKKTIRKNRPQINIQTLMMITIVVIIVLAIIGFLIITKMIHPR